jgi:alkaline phosphatase D
VKAEVRSLQPGTQYFYRVRDAAGTSAVGQFRTAAELGNRQGLRFGVAGDWQGQLTPFPALANAPERNLDFFVRLGDSAYVDDLSPDLPGVRQPKTCKLPSTDLSTGTVWAFNSPEMILQIAK